MKSRTLILTTIFLFLMGIYSQLFAQKFDFNDGTQQGWTMKGAYDESFNGPYSSYFSIGWTKLVNYLTPDPNSTKGALYVYTPGGHGITGSAGSYWILQLISPDLSSDASWQSATGFSVRITENMTVSSSLYANLVVTVYDKDQAKDRSFYNDVLLNQKLTYSSWFNTNAVWNHLTFDWSGVSTFPTNYTLKSIKIQIMGTMTGLYEGQLGVDEVVAQTGGSTASIKVTAPNGGEKWEAGTQHDITWTGQGINNYDVKIQYSTNNGSSYTFITYKTNLGTSGSYAWTVPNTPSTQCLVRLSVLLSSEISDVSDATFEITQPTQSFTFTGYVYRGNQPDSSNPVSGVTVALYGDINEWPEDGPKTLLASTTTNTSGQFTLSSGSGNSNHSYYHVFETDPAGTISVGAQAGHPGYVKNFNAVSYQNSTLTPGNTYGGSAFWDIPGNTNTPSGTNVQVDLGSGVKVTFTNVINPGNTTLAITPVGPIPPEKYIVIPPGAPLFYDIGTTATYSGNIKINIQYNDAGFGGDQEMQFKLYSYNEPQKQWTDITTSKDIQNNIIGGETTHLSVFAIMYTSGSSAGGTLVINCDDSGPGSLRAAIESANSNVGPDTINFAIPKGAPGHDANDGVWRIFPQSELPGITGHQLIINGFSQREFIGEDSNPFGPEIVINGANAGQYVSGLVVRASGGTIMGLTINNFYNIGIWMDYADGGGIFGCYVGTDLSGMEPMPNGYGIWIGNRCKYIVVAPMDTFRNVISGNTNGGIVVADTSRHVSIIGNIIGLNRKTSGSMGNGNYGGIFIQELSDSNAVFDNWIGGNKYGIYIYKSSRNNIETNWIGKTPLHPDLDLGNEYDGVYLADKSFDNRILDNVIWFNKTGGVRIYGDKPFGNRISHNSISRNGWGGIIFDSAGANMITAPTITDITGSSVSGTAIPNATIEIYTDAENQGDIFQGETVSGSNGKFTWVGNIYGPYSNVTAIAIDPAGNTSAFSKVVVVKVAEETNAMNAPRAFSLSQNYPNPFNPETAIEFQLPQPSEIEISIFNLQGQKIATLLKGHRAAGFHKLIWNGKDDSGQLATSGVYLYKLQADDLVQIRKMILIH